MTTRTSSSGVASRSSATMRVRGTMISFTTRSANSSTLLRSSSFTSSSTPSRVPTSMRYSISSLVTAGPPSFGPSTLTTCRVSQPTAEVTGHMT
ncbi:MAG: hypothetical protein QM704_18585 [Anaeromyxobacteraceae bacterium]